MTHICNPSSKEARKEESQGSLSYIVIQRTGDVTWRTILLTLVLRAIPEVRVSHLSSCAYFNISELFKQCSDSLGVGMLSVSSFFSVRIWK